MQGCWWDEGDGRRGRRLVHRPQRDCRSAPGRPAARSSPPTGAGSSPGWSGTAGALGVLLEPADGGTRLTETWEFLPDGIALFQERYGDERRPRSRSAPDAAHAGIPETLAADQADRRELSPGPPPGRRRAAAGPLSAGRGGDDPVGPHQHRRRPGPGPARASARRCPRAHRARASPPAAGRRRSAPPSRARGRRRAGRPPRPAAAGAGCRPATRAEPAAAHQRTGPQRRRAAVGGEGRQPRGAVHGGEHAPADARRVRPPPVISRPEQQGEPDQRPGVRRPLGLVGVQQRVVGRPAQHGGELPAQLVGVAQPERRAPAR